MEVNHLAIEEDIRRPWVSIPWLPNRTNIADPFCTLAQVVLLAGRHFEVFPLTAPDDKTNKPGRCV